MVILDETVASIASISGFHVRHSNTPHNSVENVDWSKSIEGSAHESNACGIAGYTEKVDGGYGEHMKNEAKNNYIPVV